MRTEKQVRARQKSNYQLYYRRTGREAGVRPRGFPRGILTWRGSREPAYQWHTLVVGGGGTPGGGHPFLTRRPRAVSPAPVACPMAPGIHTPSGFVHLFRGASVSKVTPGMGWVLQPRGSHGHPGSRKDEGSGEGGLLTMSACTSRSRSQPAASN